MQGFDSIKQLVTRCADGDGAAWEVLVTRFGPMLERVALAALARLGRPRDVDQARDLVQDTYCRLLADGGRRLRSCRAASKPELEAFLLRVVRHVVVDHRRAAWAAKRGGGRLASTEAVSWIDPVAGRDSDPEHRLLMRERLKAFLGRCREALTEHRPERDLRIIRLALLEGRSSAEIALELGDGLAPSSIDSLLSRLRRRLETRGLRLADRRSLAG